MVARDYDHLFKVIMVGDTAVGKTSICRVFNGEDWLDGNKSTIGVDFKTKMLNINNKRIKIQLWDTAGQERFRSITRSIYRGTSGILFMYDVTNRDSLTNIAKWVEEARGSADKPFKKLLLGNKVDLQQQRVVGYDEASAFAGSLNLDTIDVSAKTKYNIEQAFDTLAREMLEQAEGEQANPGNQGDINHLNGGNEPVRRGTCC